MAWSISYLEDQRIIQTIYQQPLTLEELKEAALANLTLAAEKRTGLFLADCSSFTEKGSTMDIYELGRFLEMVSRKIELSVKEAILDPPAEESVTSDLKFFETVAQNRMLKVRVFRDRDAAITWLID